LCRSYGSSSRLKLALLDLQRVELVLELPLLLLQKFKRGFGGEVGECGGGVVLRRVIMVEDRRHNGRHIQL
jgi:hypothetical protein